MSCYLVSSGRQTSNGSKDLQYFISNINILLGLLLLLDIIDYVIDSPSPLILIHTNIDLESR